MTDNNNAPQYSKQIEEDLPSQEELVENPYCDDDSAPVTQNFSGIINLNIIILPLREELNKLNKLIQAKLLIPHHL